MSFPRGPYDNAAFESTIKYPVPVAEKAHRQAWSDAERKQLCEYAEAQHKLHGTRPPWKQIKSWWKAENPDKVCLYVVNRITSCRELY